MGEDLLHALGTGRLARSQLWIQRNVLGVGPGDGGADLVFDEGLDDQGEEVAAQKAFDAHRVLEQPRGDQLVALELLVAALEVRLYLYAMSTSEALMWRSFVMRGKTPSMRAS